MGKELFGTDGIRGVAREYPLDAPTVYAFGLALGADLKRRGAGVEVLLGADTRESGPWIAELVAGGLTAAGAHVRHAGIITTPGVAYLTRTGPFAAGVMISASHNPYRDNGIKVFGHNGFKLPDDEEHEIEQEIFRLLRGGVHPVTFSPVIEDDLDHAYLDALAATMEIRLDGLHLVADCGNGAAYRLAPQLLERLGAQVTALNAEPNGTNINLHCGALHVEGLSAAVVAAKADLGVAFDGDADRAIFAAANGEVVNGDGVLLACARSMQAAGKLDGGLVVATVMSNLGLEQALTRSGIRMVRTPVGDKYVLEEMVRLGAMLGGEQSGHVIFRQFATTGDGMLTALRVLATMRRANQPLDRLIADLQVHPQRLVNVRVREKKELTQVPSVAREIRRVEEAFGGTGRVLVRFSGTEPLARVMVEGPDAAQVDAASTSIAEVIRREMGEG